MINFVASLATACSTPQLYSGLIAACRVPELHYIKQCSRLACRTG